MNWKNRLLCGLVALLKKRRQANPLGQHFLIVSTTGLGDTLWATPALRALKERYPQARVTVLTSGVGRAVLEGNPHVDEFVIASSGWELAKAWLKLRRTCIDTALLFHTSQRLALPVCAAAGIKRIVGVQGMQKGLDHLLTTTLERVIEHEIERRCRLVEAVGARVDSRLLEVHMATRPATVNPKLIGIHPGAAVLFKQYPPDLFIRVGKELRERYGATIVVTGSTSESPLTEHIACQIDGAASLAGKQSVQELAAQIGKLALFITGDTGPMHIAFALRTPTVALFGPTDPALCGPHHATNVHIIQTHRCCTPCIKKRCRDPFCMRQIPTSALLHACLCIMPSAGPALNP